ncbi:aminotransferase class I/II-fold pyridoxal phosphate-dependent enzyme [Paenibacillus harenae]|uniref:Arginine/lysine/ornithine decarboxylase n=1 Tax=Paenibacillus harenae TaxID=306543 RepID=A0ABT9U9T6_PAEHA|nr:aminotransferase class I/II-fold pyridoxal phosphate-dependent enzyme [Paenibacillus harenae]MDQ0116022.1 arginine/lysine/ornithine decarboxylase [Paenibacillus harenae]
MKPFFAPLFETLIKHADTDPVSLHVPGHRGGHAIAALGQMAETDQSYMSYFHQIMKLDVTELASTDDLHHPEGSIKEAQQLAASCFGSEETFFLVGGSTSGNIALLLAICDPGDQIIVQRNVHKSVINGLKLAGASAIFLTPLYERHSALAVIPSLNDIEQALQQYPEAKAVFLTNPNYYGMGVDLRTYADIIHRYDKLLLVDEAHGAHYGLHPDLPSSAIAAGADAVVQSTHKTLPALTMGAMLHVQGEHMPRQALRQSLAMIQSSSPSFPILSSLDISRAMIDRFGTSLFDGALDQAASFRRWFNQHGAPISVLEAQLDNVHLSYVDPLRIVLYDRSGTLSGYELQKQLEQHGCWAEMADPRHVVLIFGIHISGDHTNRLKEAIAAISKQCKALEANVAGTAIARSYKRQPAGMELSSGVDERISLPISFAKTLLKNQQQSRVPLSEAENCTAAEMVIPYPPGIPVVYPGEKLTSRIIEQIARLAATGAKFQGAIDPGMHTIEVYK